MNTFAASRSLLFRLIGWLFLVVLVCDGANLDDLLPGTVVLHDDDEIAAESIAPCLSPLVCAANHAHQPFRAVQIHRGRSHPRQFQRIIIDQDSPSLAARGLEGDFSCLDDVRESSPSSLGLSPAANSLYLRNCSLLI